MDGRAGVRLYGETWNITSRWVRARAREWRAELDAEDFPVFFLYPET